MYILWGVHISDGYLHWSWLAVGYTAGIIFAALGLRQLDEVAVVRIALLTAASFVASSLRVPVGPTSVHLLLNGLVGVILGWRAGLAIFLGLLLQFLFAGHGGITTVGVNACVQTIPALAVGVLFRLLVGRSWRGVAGRASLVVIAATVWLLALAVGVELFYRSLSGLESIRELDPSELWAFSPMGLLVLLALALLAGLVERRLESSPLFSLGVLLGVVSVVGASLLNCLTLYYGAAGDWQVLALAVLLAHLPVAAVEGLIVGVMVGFLARVKPDLLGLPATLGPTAPSPGQS